MKKRGNKSASGSEGSELDIDVPQAVKIEYPQVLFTSDVPTYFDEEWRDVANKFCGRNKKMTVNVMRIVWDVRLRNFWNGISGQIESFISRHFTNPSDLADVLKTQILLALVTKGDKPDGTKPIIEAKAKRKKMVPVAKKLLRAMRAENGASSLAAEDVINWTYPENRDWHSRLNTHYYVGTCTSFPMMRPPFLTEHVPDGLKMVDLLAALVRRLEKGQPLTFLDATARSPFAAAPGRSTQTHLEHYIVEQFAQLSSPMSGELWAPAIEVSLGLDAGKVNPDRLAERFRKIFAKNDKTFSGKT